MKRCVRSSLVVSAAMCLFSSVAQAKPFIEEGYTGKQGNTCAAGGCHSATSPKPQVTLTGPTTITAGSVNDYTLTVTGAGTLKCFMAPTNGVAIMATSNTWIFNFSELSAANRSGGNCTFKLTAPPTSGQITIWYLGAQSTGGVAGVGFRNASMNVTVTGGTAPVPDSGVPPVTDSGVPPRTDSGTPPVKVDGGGVVTPLSDGGSIITYPDGAVAPGPAQTPRGSSLTPADDEGGCNASGSPLSLSGIFAAGAVATFLLGSRRLARRRRS